MCISASAQFGGGVMWLSRGDIVIIIRMSEVTIMIALILIGMKIIIQILS